MPKPLIGEKKKKGNGTKKRSVRELKCQKKKYRPEISYVDVFNL